MGQRRSGRAWRAPARAMAFVALGAVLLAIASLAPGYYTFGNGHGLKWGDPAFGTRAVVTWGFMADGTAVAPDFRIDPWSYPDISGVIGTSNISQLRNSIDAVHGAGAFDAAVARAFDT